MKILFDTDIGTNIDDSLALAYLLNNPDCELLGITTVTEPTGKRAALASEMCGAAGQEVPVYPGSDVLQDIETEGEALQFLCSSIRANPGEITLLTTGPFTTIARLFQFDPEIPSLLKMMVSMAGVYFPETQKVRSRETNIILDPHAAAEVFSNSPEITRIAGLDVTLSCMKTREEAIIIAEGFALPPLTAQLTKWLETKENVYFHDPLAAVLAFKPGLCAWEKGQIDIDTGTGECRFEAERAGKGGKSPHRVAHSVDIEGFFKEYEGKR